MLRSYTVEFATLIFRSKSLIICSFWFFSSIFFWFTSSCSFTSEAN